MKYALLKLWRRFFPLEKFSDECPACHGASGFESRYDPSPPGVSLSPGYMTDFDECEYCVGRNRCSSCGTEMSQVDFDVFIANETTPCPFCRVTQKECWDHGYEWRPDDFEPDYEPEDYL